jgi:hypothetical protein
METGEDCGFCWELVTVDQIGPRVRAATTSIAGAIRNQSTRSLVRPSLERWSALEYAAHVRDVYLTIRDRLVIGLVEENPGFKPMHRDERVSLGLYAADAVEDVSVELEATANMLLRLFGAIEPQHLDRIVQ